MSEAEQGPIYPRGVFGDGTFVQVIRTTPVLGKNNEKFIKIEMRLIPEVRDKFKIAESEYSDRGTITREYPAVYYGTLSDDPEWPFKIILCGFEGAPTILTEKEGELLEETRSQQKKIYAQKAKIALLEEQLSKQGSNLREYNRNTIEGYQEIMALRGRYDSPEQINTSREVNREYEPAFSVKGNQER